MQIINSPAEMQAISRAWARGKSIGFVPTMGFLHEGHLSLVRESKRNCDTTVVSIFVNPSQFGANEDLGSYPRDMKRDLELLEGCQADYVFCPEANDMYPKPYHSWVNVDGLSEVLCGASRPGHFRGVATVVLKLVNLVKPDYMYMGEKDFQQVAVLNTLLKELNVLTRIVSCPIVREPDGLAMSSRNTYLTGEARQQALCLSKAIIAAKAMYKKGCRNVSSIITECQSIISSHGGETDYIKIVNPYTLIEVLSPEDNSRIILAVKIGKTRLIDNASLRPDTL
jgi:pantoate--beta-alanine ligase